jgi:predicted SnoaL-like aldol condensation-catalyzing enzyme
MFAFSCLPVRFLCGNDAGLRLIGRRPAIRRKTMKLLHVDSGILGDLFATWSFSVKRAFTALSVIASSIAILLASALAQSQDRRVITTDALGANARQAMIDIFRKKDPTAVDRYFAESFIQHDPNLLDGRAGMKSFVAEVATSPAAEITIYRTLVDGDLVLLHSSYQGVGRYGQNAIAFDLFRFSGGKIAEHWGGQESEEPPNASGRTQVGGPTDVVDREKTEANRTLVRAYRETVMVALRSDRIEEFVSAALVQHASQIGDGIAQLRSRIASVAKEGGQLYLTPRRYVAEGNFVLVLTEGDLPSGSTALYDLVRVENGKIVEHWDVLTPIPPRDQWKNANGPF